MRSLADLQEPRDRGESGVVDGWLTIGEVVERLRAAGWPDSQWKVRRDIDRGIYGERGIDWYADEASSYRYVKPEAVDRMLARRRGESS